MANIIKHAGDNTAAILVKLSNEPFNSNLFTYIDPFYLLPSVLNLRRRHVGWLQNHPN